MTAFPRFVAPPEPSFSAKTGELAALCLELEVATYPKPGLVSHIDNGAHHDMNFALLLRSAKTLTPFFTELAHAGAGGARIDRLRAIGVEAERAMLAATGGVNTHRGAIFGFGLLCAAAGFRRAYRIDRPLGALIADRWGEAILSGSAALRSHGAEAARRHGVGGARREAAQGLPSVYAIALPALRAGRALAPSDEGAARVQACMALIATVADTNLLHRGGAAGLEFAHGRARAFLEAGGVGAANWRDRATAIHRAFVARNLSPGGCADLLAMALFVDRSEA
jgi:triphosphoribosyl-dephospho-CoA synthase